MIKNIAKIMRKVVLWIPLDLRGYPQRKLVYCWNWPIKMIHLVKVSTKLKVQKESYAKRCIWNEEPEENKKRRILSVICRCRCHLCPCPSLHQLM